MRMAASLQTFPRGNPQSILATVWQRNLPLVRQRVLALHEAAESSRSAPLGTAARHEAVEIAHKLAGSLGMFGFSQGSEVAKLLELLLDSEGEISAVTFGELTSQLEQALTL